MQIWSLQKPSLSKKSMKKYIYMFRRIQHPYNSHAWNMLLQFSCWYNIKCSILSWPLIFMGHCDGNVLTGVVKLSHWKVWSMWLLLCLSVVSTNSVCVTTAARTASTDADRSARMGNSKTRANQQWQTGLLVSH